jgi:putative DNA primase/helicase
MADDDSFPAPVEQVDPENKDTPFEQLIFPIGFSGERVLLYDKRTKQYYLIKGSDLKRSLITLHPDDAYWMQHFVEAIGKKGMLDTEYVVRKLILECQNTKRNIQDVEIREAGIYYDNDRVVANYGENIFVDGQEMQFNEIKSKYFYKSCGKSHLDTRTVDVDFEEVMGALSFATPTDIKFFMGTIFSGYLSGAVEWRTHAWITGEMGSGKSQIKEKILEQAIIPIHGISRSGTLTEASIRQLTQSKATIFVHDEAETSTHFEKEMNLIRESSSGGRISRGSQNGEAMTFNCQNTYISKFHSFSKGGNNRWLKR